jgi:hypothetical protein
MLVVSHCNTVQNTKQTVLLRSTQQALLFVVTALIASYLITLLRCTQVYPIHTLRINATVFEMKGVTSLVRIAVCVKY